MGKPNMLKQILPYLLLVLLAVVLAACGSFQAPTFQAPTSAPSGDAIATEVAHLLTTTPQNNSVMPPTSLAPTTTQPPVVTATQPAQPSPTIPAPTATQLPPTPTTVPLPTATTDLNDPRLSLGSPDFSDTKFKEGTNWGKAWEDDFTKGEFKDNQLVLTSVGVDGWTLSWPKVSDFYLEMKVKTGDCERLDRYGMIVRVPESFDTGYQFGFSCDGRYSLRIWDPEEKQYIDLVKWTSSSAINAGSGQTNRLGLKAEGSKISLYANGHFLTSVNDTHFAEGRFGPFIGHDKTNDFTIYLQEVSMWKLP